MAIKRKSIGHGMMVANNQKPDIDRMLSVLEPYQTPFLQWLYFINRDHKVVTNESAKYSWFEKDIFPHQTTITTALSAGSTYSLTSSNVANISIFNVNDILLFEDTDEMGYVSSITTFGSDATVTPLSGTLSAISTTGGYIKKIGTRHSERGTTPESMMIQEEEKYNYLNIFKEAVAMTGRQQGAAHYTDGLKFDERVEEKVKEMRMTMERYMMLSTQRGTSSSGDYLTTYGKGLLGFISTNDNSYSGALTESVFDEHLKEVFAKGSNTRIHMAGSDQIQDINQFLKDKYELEANNKVLTKYGIDVRTYVCPFGRVSIMWNPILDGKYVDYGITFDPSKISMRYFTDDSVGSRKFRIKQNTQDNDVDEREVEILADLGIQVKLEEVHGVLRKA